MSHLLERLKEVCSSNNAIISTLGKIMACITPLLVIKEHFQMCTNSFIPSYIERIVHFDTHYAKIHIKYIGRKNMYSIKNAHSDLMDLSETGYYLFHVWNKYNRKYEYYLLRTDLLTKALSIRNMNSIWAFHDYGIIQLLSNYIEYTLMNNSNNKILGITVNRKDETKVLKPFMSSIYIPNNITPFVLYMLSQYLRSERLYYVDAKGTECVYSDEELNEISIKKSDEYLISAKEELKCPLCCNISYKIHTETTSEESDEIEELFEEKDKDL